MKPGERVPIFVREPEVPTLIRLLSILLKVDPILTGIILIFLILI